MISCFTSKLKKWAASGTLCARLIGKVEVQIANFMHIGHFKQKIYIHWSTALRVTRLKVVARKFLSVKKWHLITSVKLFRRFNCHQIPHIDFGLGAHKGIAILRCPTHRKRVLNGRHQNSIYIAQCQLKLHIHWVCLSENFIYIGRCETKLYAHCQSAA